MLTWCHTPQKSLGEEARSPSSMHKHALPILGISKSILDPSDPCNTLYFLLPSFPPSC